MATGMLPDSAVSGDGKSQASSGNAARRSVRRSGRSRKKPPVSRLKLIPAEADWQEWDRVYGVPVLRGEIVVGQLTMLAVERHYRDLQQGAKRGLFFSPGHAWHVINYVQGWFVHIKGPLARQPIMLDGWQLFWTAVIFGWRRASDGCRRFRTGYEEVARKNGKSTWWGPIGSYLWMMDGEGGAEVYSIATTREQAMSVFKPAFDNIKRLRRQSPRLAKSVRIFDGANQEKMSIGESVYKPLPANAESLDGLNPYACLVDELHAHKTREVWDVMESALGARTQPLINAITTAGFILDGICIEIRSYLVRILRGEVQDDSFFGVIYTIDEGDDPFSSENWPKANPSLGSAKTYSYMEAQAAKAKIMPSARANFLTKDLNVFVGDSLSWFDMLVWDKGKKKFDPCMLQGRECFGGLDLASTRDITAFVLLFPPPPGDEDGEWYVLVWAWVPQAKVDAADQDNGSDYKAWEKQGWLTVTEGDVTDYDPIREVIEQACRDFDVREIAFDTWNSTHLANQLLEKDVPMVKLPQNFAGLSPGAKHLERLVYSKRLRHGGNPLLRWCAGNVTLLMDSNENIKPDKKRSQGRIDPIVALSMAATRAMTYLDDETEVEVIC
ncbi:phage terminase large subunit-like protein [Aquitalea magnusonii]|uniref:Phage terminase large subunit-like protein n=3 Tax=Aquitalea magnusonii TaxID=332411 RepID=A0A318JFL7_9NEIS|nr:phage terminase large subunit-like protein [Aquitalea magnusonii]